MKIVSSRAHTIKIFLSASFFIPLVFYWVYSFWIAPSENYYTNDAQFPYFMNSLAVYDGGSYQYVDHPGTPVEILGTVLIGITYPFLANTPNGFIFHHLQNPGIFFNIAYAFLVFMHLTVMLVFFRIAQSSLKLETPLVSAALATMYFAIHIDSLSSSLIWNHNSFGFPFGTLLFLYAVKVLTRAEQRSEAVPTFSLTVLGLGAGVLTATTLYMFSFWIGIILAVGLYYLFTKKAHLKTLLALATVAASSAIGFFISILPVLSKMPIFFDWIFKIFTHESRYLAVPENEPTLARIIKNIAGMWESLPALLIVIVITLILAVIVVVLNKKRISENPASWAIAIGFSVQMMTLLFILLDRPSRPAYFLSLAATIPVLVFAFIKILEDQSTIYRVVVRIGSLLIFAGIIWTTLHAIHTRQSEIDSLNVAQEKVSSIIKEYAQQTGRPTDDIVTLWMHDTYSVCWGLRLGNNKANRIFTSELDILCKNQYELTKNMRVIMPDKSTLLSEMSWDIIFTCNQWTDDLLEFDPSLVVEPQPDVQWTCGNMVTVTKRQ